MQWRNKEEKKADKCDLVLYAQDQNSKWYMNSGYSRHTKGPSDIGTPYSKGIEKFIACLDHL